MVKTKFHLFLAEHQEQRPTQMESVTIVRVGTEDLAMTEVISHDQNNRENIHSVLAKPDDLIR